MLLNFSRKVLRVEIRFDGWFFESSNAIRLLPN